MFAGTVFSVVFPLKGLSTLSSDWFYVAAIKGKKISEGTEGNDWWDWPGNKTLIKDADQSWNQKNVRGHGLHRYVLLM